MTVEDIDKLDKLRREKKDLEYFIKGGGNFKMKWGGFVLLKDFGCGKWEYRPDKETTKRIKKLLVDKLLNIEEEIASI